MLNCLQIHLYTFWQDVSVSVTASLGYVTGGSVQLYLNIIPKCLQREVIPKCTHFGSALLYLWPTQTIQNIVTKYLGKLPLNPSLRILAVREFISDSQHTLKLVVTFSCPKTCCKTGFIFIFGGYQKVHIQ